MPVRENVVLGNNGGTTSAGSQLCRVESTSKWLWGCLRYMATFVKSCQVRSRFSGVYLCQVCSSVLYENMQVCNMWAKVTISVSVPQVPNLSILVTWICTVLHWRNQQGGNQQISCGQEQLYERPCVEFGPSYDVRNRADKEVTVSCYRFDCPGPKRTLGWPRVTLFGLR